MRMSAALQTVSRAGGTFGAVELKLAGEGFVEIGHVGISEVVVTPALGTNPYVEGADYEISPRLGMIRRLPDGAITAGETVSITGKEAASTGAIIQGGTRPRIVMRFRLDGENLVNGENLILRADQVVVMSTEAHNFLQAEIATATLTGDMEIPAGKDAPFELEYL